MDIKPYMARFGFGHRASRHIVVEQGGTLWLAFASEGAGMFMMSGDAQGSGLLEISLLRDGKPVPYTYTATQSLIELTDGSGKINIAIEPGADALIFRGTDAALRLAAKPEAMSMSVNSLNTPRGAEVNIGGGRYLFSAKKGAPSFDDTWILNQFHSVTPVYEITPDNGVFELVAYNIPADTEAPKITKTLVECAQASAADFEDFCKSLISTPESWADLRDCAAYLLWLGNRTIHGGEIITENKLKSPNSAAWLQAVASLAFKDAAKAISLITTLPSDSPPLQGFAVSRLLKDAMIKNISRNTVFKLYEYLKGIVRNRDSSRTSHGHYFYAYRYETGKRTPAVFSAGEPVVSPDLTAYMALVFRALAGLSEHIHISGETARWRERELLECKALMAANWNGGVFTGMNIYTGEKSAPDSVLSYIPLILGTSLPPEIAEKLAGELEENLPDSALGIISLLGLFETNSNETAKRIAIKVLETARENGVNCPFYGAALLAVMHKVLL